MTLARGRVRSLSAAILLSALLVVLLGGWFASGWRDVRTRQEELRRAPRTAADDRARQLARDLKIELDALMTREVQRPYFHYQNLMRDPRSAGINVTPSPLSGGPEHAFVLGYFQLDAKGRATTPTINDEVPSLSASERLVDYQRFRDQVSRDLAQLKPPDMPAAPTPVATTAAATPPSQMVNLDPSVYAQNQMANSVFQSQQALMPSRLPVLSERQSGPVTILVAPLEWRTEALAGAPTLLAARRVDTPDGSLTQGLVLDRTAIDAWLASKAGAMRATLRSGDMTASVAPGWGVTIEPDAASLAHANEESEAVSRAFLIRFAGVAVLALVAAGSVLLLVARAERLARERSQFAASAAHELRTPLAGLQLYGDMLADGLGDPAKTEEYARHISEDAARLGRVVSNMLGFSQLERGKLSVTPRVAPLDEVLREMGERAGPALARAGATLVVDVPAGLVARYDRDALTRIVSNLVDNAEKYTRGVSDRTILVAAAERGDQVEISVEDRGPGVSDESKLFQPFSRGKADSGGPEGLGLGLALSRSLARAMGGDLAHRPSAVGTTFVLTLRRE